MDNDRKSLILSASCQNRSFENNGSETNKCARKLETTFFDKLNLDIDGLRQGWANYSRFYVLSLMYFHNSSTRNRDHHILLIITGNAHKESCHRLSLILVREQELKHNQN